MYNGPHGIKKDDDMYVVESGSHNYILRFTLSNYPNLRVINIGDNCFSSVKSFTINELNRLIILSIGKDSFTQSDYVNKYVERKDFHILNCESLQQIEIGKGSFSDFSGQFELKNLSSLQSIRIGTMDTIDGPLRNFVGSAFEIRGNSFI